ncbi:hypothetical protein LTS18_004086 [Coniosporium uncinatum]|uniref:Uncharacterized protein n=1 Tax=Coniosporium uncinatum TaxID=93489 RepID=A0ACC3DBA1_9PEZI|nr:hypothetical protein LTS18_004086 [Coniosporium uncinatum]
MAAWSKIASMGHVPGNTYDMMKMKRKYITPVSSDAKDGYVDAADPSIISHPPHLTINTILFHSQEYVPHAAYLPLRAKTRKKKHLEQKAAVPKQTIFHPEHPKSKRVQPREPKWTINLAYNYVPPRLSAELMDHNGKSVHQISSDVKT